MTSRLAPTGMPDEVLRAKKGIDGMARVLTIRFLMGSPSSTHADVVAGAAISDGAVTKALLELERLGYVVADIPKPRSGKVVRYSVARTALTDDLDALAAWLLS